MIDLANVIERPSTAALPRRDTMLSRQESSRQHHGVEPASNGKRIGDTSEGLHDGKHGCRS